MSKSITTAEVIRQLAKNAEALPNAPLWQMLLPPIVTHLALDLELPREEAIKLFDNVWRELEPAFPQLKAALAEAFATGKTSPQELADLGDAVIIEKLGKKGTPS